MHNALDEGKRLTADPKKHESKNGGQFYAGSGGKMKKVGGTGKNKISTTSRNSKRGNYAE